MIVRHKAAHDLDSAFDIHSITMMKLKETILKIKWDVIARILACVVLYGVATCMFTAPNDIVPGGVGGLATALASVIPLKLGTINLILSTVVEITGALVFGLHFIIRSSITSVLLSLFLNVFQGVIPVYTADPLAASIGGGALLGLGSAILLQRGISAGGTDTVAMVANKFIPHLRVGEVLLIADAFVVIIGTLIFRNIEVAIYSAFSIFVCGKVVDGVLVGMDRAKMLFVMSESSEEIRAWLIRHEMGVTVLNGAGGYLQTDREVLMVVLKRTKYAHVIKKIRSMDPRAFVIVGDASEVLGEGFKEE